MTKTVQFSIRKTVEQLETLFEQLNSRFFGNELSRPVIALVYNQTRRKSYGWCTTWKPWKKPGDSDGEYEINICPEYLTRPIEEVCGTLMHEMVHLLNIKNGIKDVSRNGTYHNKKFKDTAEQHGLIIERDENIGWSITSLNEEAKEFCKTLNIVEFDIVRIKLTKDGEEKPKPPKKPKKPKNKLICPSCQNEVSSKRSLNIICDDCHVKYKKDMEEEDCVDN